MLAMECQQEWVKIIILAALSLQNPPFLGDSRATIGADATPHNRQRGGESGTEIPTGTAVATLDFCLLLSTCHTMALRNSNINKSCHGFWEKQLRNHGMVLTMPPKTSLCVASGGCARSQNFPRALRAAYMCSAYPAQVNHTL